MYSTSAIVGLAYAIDLFFTRINLKNKEFCYGVVFKVLFSLSAFFCYTMVDNVLFAQTQSSDSEYDIVYVYINVADSEKSWRQGIEKYNLEGINLIAEGWSKNPVCQAYNVLGIPHYVLIDEDGMVVKNKTDRPSDILRKKSKSEFDQTVRKNKSSI